MEEARKVEIRGVLLNLPGSYWEQFVKDGDLNGDALLAAGYDGEGQVEWIRDEMVKMSWLEKDAKIIKAEPKADAKKGGKKSKE